MKVPVVVSPPVMVTLFSCWDPTAKVPERLVRSCAFVSQMKVACLIWVEPPPPKILPPLVLVAVMRPE